MTEGFDVRTITSIRGRWGAGALHLVRTAGDYECPRGKLSKKAALGDNWLSSFLPAAPFAWRPFLTLRFCFCFVFLESARLTRRER